MNRLIIIRGIPGSGKSTLARKLTVKIPHSIVTEADMYFEDYDDWNGREVGKAHIWAQSLTRKQLFNQRSVIHTGTLCTAQQLLDFLTNVIGDLKSRVPKIVEIVDMKTQFESIHNVSESTLESMRRRYEETKDIDVETIFHQLHFNVKSKETQDWDNQVATRYYLEPF